MADEILEFKDVSVRFGDETIYQDFTFSVREQEFLCILGPSGCGKSTSLRLIGDLLDVQEGTVLVEGQPASEAWQKLAYVFQSPRLVPWRTALGNVLLGMELRSGTKDRKKDEETARYYLELVGLANDMNKYPSMLSGGERQRVSLARALSVNPSIILMDEPFSALDPNTRQRLRSEIISIWKKTKKTVVFVTHDIDEALTLADRILMLSNKPTKVLETLELPEPRPRDIASTASLRDRRDHLVGLFRQLEAVAPQQREEV